MVKSRKRKTRHTKPKNNFRNFKIKFGTRKPSWRRLATGRSPPKAKFGKRRTNLRRPARRPARRRTRKASSKKLAIKFRKSKTKTEMRANSPRFLRCWRCWQLLVATQALRQRKAASVALARAEAEASGKFDLAHCGLVNRSRRCCKTLAARSRLKTGGAVWMRWPPGCHAQEIPGALEGGSDHCGRPGTQPFSEVAAGPAGLGESRVCHDQCERHRGQNCERRGAG